MTIEKVLLVDDNNGQRMTLESILKKSGFNIVSADCGNAALSVAEKEQFAAALLDIKMPDITGIEVLKELKSHQPGIVVIMMTGYSEPDYCISALNAGASAYLLKPANIEQIKALLHQAIEHQRLTEENHDMAQALRELNTTLEDKVNARTRQLAEAQRRTIQFYEELKKNFESTLEVLSIAIDQRDPLTSSHSFRVTQYAIELAKIMGQDQDSQDVLRYSGLMHDLGKIEIKEAILRKEGSLTAEEYKEIQTHAHGTFSLLSRFKFKNNLSNVPLIASSHHERYDGSGYPQGLKGEEIPLLARILAVADVTDAITSKRHYRSAMSILDALSIIQREAGGHFDTKCAAALFNLTLSKFIQIHLSEHLNILKPEDLIELDSYTLQNLYDFCKRQDVPSKEFELIQRFHNYYQGPVPIQFEGKITPAPNFDQTPLS